MAGRTKLAALVVAAALLGLGAFLYLAREPEAQQAHIEPAVADSDLPADSKLIQPPQQVDSSAVRTAVPEADAHAKPGSQESDAQSTGPSRWLRAHVVDELGAPLAGAIMSYGHRPVLQATSGPDGNVALAIPVASLGSEPTIALEFTAEGRTSERRRVDLRPEGDCHAGEIMLRGAGSIVGRVVVDNGSPARIAVSTYAPLPELSEQDREKVATTGWGLSSRGNASMTDEDGSYRIDDVEVGPSIVAARQAASLYGWSEPFTVQAGQVVDAGTLVLRAPAPDQCIEGVVLDAEGKPCPSRTVQLWKPGVARNVDPTLKSQSTDAEGRFRLPVARNAVVHVVLLDEALSEEVARIENVSPGGPSLVVRVPPKRFLEVLVSSEQGAPLEDAVLMFSDADGVGMRVRPQKTGAGTWRIELPGRRFRLWANAQGYESRQSDVDPATSPERIELVLQPVRGACLMCVVKRNGEPVAGAQIIAFEPLEGLHRLNTGFATRLASQPAASESANAEGVCDLRIQRAGSFVLLVLVEGRVALEHGPIPVGPDDPERRIELDLPAPATIEGRVLVAEGRDPAGILLGASRGDGEVRAIAPGSTAEFRLEGLAPGNWQVRPMAKLYHPNLLVDRREYRDDKAPTWDVVLEAGQTARFDVDLRHQSLCRLRGRVRLSPDDPASWRFQLAQEFGEVASDGTFHVDTFEPGPTNLSLWANYGPSKSLAISEQLDLRAGETQWALDLLTAELELSGVPAFESKDPRGREDSELLRLQWKDSGAKQGTLRVFSHGGGPLVLRGLPPGTWTVETRYLEDGSADREWHRHPTEIVLAPGGRQVIEL